MPAPKSVCYLSSDFSKHMAKLPAGTILCPEQLLNGEQIIAWVADLKKTPKVFATCSRFLLREMFLQGSPADFINLGVDYATVQSAEDLSEIEIIERHREQSQRWPGWATWGI